MAQDQPAMLLDPALGKLATMTQQNHAATTAKASARDVAMLIWRDWLFKGKLAAQKSFDATRAGDIKRV